MGVAPWECFGVGILTQCPAQLVIANERCDSVTQQYSHRIILNVKTANQNNVNGLIFYIWVGIILRLVAAVIVSSRNAPPCVTRQERLRVRLV